jgi:RNA polymerase sigma-70 factor (ECF subfamily)
MDRLPPHYRVLVHGHYVKGVKYEELAAALQIPIGTVKTHLFRAKRQLRQMLEGDLA